MVLQQKFITRRMQEAMGEPVGDPFGGPAYSQKTFIGAIMGIGSIIGGISAWGAATSIVATIAAGAMIVGGAMTVLGSVTGNADLAKIGGVLSLAGGVTNFFAGGGMDTVSNFFSDVDSASALNTNGITNGVDSFGGLPTGSDLTTALPSTAMDGGGLLQIGGVPQVADAGSLTANANLADWGGGVPASAGGAVATGDTLSGIDLSGYGNLNVADTANIGNVGAEAGGVSGIETGGGLKSVAGDGLGVQAPSQAAQANGAVAPSTLASAPGGAQSGGLLSDISKFTKENDTVLKWAGDFLKSGFAKDKTVSKKVSEDLVKAQTGDQLAMTRLNNVRADYEAQKMANGKSVIGNLGLLNTNNPNGMVTPNATRQITSNTYYPTYG